MEAKWMIILKMNIVVNFMRMLIVRWDKSKGAYCMNCSISRETEWSNYSAIEDFARLQGLQ
jgi:hypothetical protein